MGIETFPEIESFQKLPRQIIIKGGSSSLDEASGDAELRGIVINNCGQSVRDVRANVVLFNEKKIPVLNTSTDVVPDKLPQGAIGTFVFRFKEYRSEISDYHLFTNWRFDDRE
ncbi:MAG: hypothetical protein JW893_02720 [Candidatus Omnitrophica bacterium]|nr:hypothetical protein [Candidatus Omnitrophota bacterium]